MSRGWQDRWRPAWAFGGLLLAYFAFPVEWDTSVGVVASLVLTAVGLGVLGRGEDRAAVELVDGHGRDSIAEGAEDAK